MYRQRRSVRKNKGIALFAALLFVAVFSALSVAMFTMSQSNSIASVNLHTVNEARASAESGLEVIRYYLAQAAISGSVSESQRFSNLATSLTGMSGASFTVNDAGTMVTLGSVNSPVTLSSDGSQTFYAELTPNGTDGVNVTIVGESGQIDRTIEGGFDYGVRNNSVFDYGVATKGPLSLQGNILLDGVNISVESDVYIESAGYNEALEIIGNSAIAGDVKIVNPDGYVTLQGGQASIGGETGIDAIQNHVDVGVESTEFPYPDTSHFEQYLSGDLMAEVSPSQAVYENITIPAGTNPNFSGDVQLKGVIYIETPNTVTFSGNVDITGIIVGDGDVNDNSATNTLDFQGNVSSSSVATLDESYGSLRDETGTFIMAPGFHTSFGGSFDTLNGCIASNGVEFYGNAGGIIGGSVVNYSDQPMEFSGNADLLFNRSGITDVPAGFVPEVVIHYDPTDYDEVL